MSIPNVDDEVRVNYMKKTIIILSVLVLVVFMISGFKEGERSAIKVENVALSADQAYFKIYPGYFYAPHKLTLQVNIESSNGTISEGAKPIELNNIPEKGIEFRVPLSKSLSSNISYNVELNVESSIKGVANQHFLWPEVTLTIESSSEFIQKNYNPIREVRELTLARIPRT